MQQMDAATKSFNDIDIYDIPLETLLHEIRNQHRNSAIYVVTPNADHFYRLDKKDSSEFVESYQHADIRLCDSRIIQKLSILERKKIRNVIPGSDLTRRIFEDPYLSKKRIFSIGPSNDDAALIRAKYNLPSYTNHTPPMGFIKSPQEVSKCVELSIKSSADFIFIAVGSPQQEILAHKIKQAVKGSPTTNAMILCVGASFDFMSGRISRAPIILQKLHLEWLHRALSSPKRLIPRYTRNLLWILKYISLHLPIKLKRKFSLD